MPENSDRLTHLDDAGRAHIVDVSEKAVTAREATARSCVRMQPATLNAIVGGDVPKGDVLAVARVAGVVSGSPAGLAARVARNTARWSTECGGSGSRLGRLLLLCHGRLCRRLLRHQRCEKSLCGLHLRLDGGKSHRIHRRRRELQREQCTRTAIRKTLKTLKTLQLIVGKYNK